jgi:hypothetical protein
MPIIVFESSTTKTFTDLESLTGCSPSSGTGKYPEQPNQYIGGSDRAFRRRGAKNAPFAPDSPQRIDRSGLAVFRQHGYFASVFGRFV